jgi:hypothetical protein
LPTRPHKSIPEPWFSFLRELDAAVHKEVRLDCMGGFVISLVYGFSRVGRTRTAPTLSELGVKASLTCVYCELKSLSN